MNWIAAWFVGMGIFIGIFITAYWLCSTEKGEGSLFICTSCGKPHYEGKRMVGRIDGKRVCLRCWDKA